MIALAAAATTMFSFGDFTSTGFENDPPYKAGELLSTTNDDNGKVDGESGFARTWVALPPEEIVVSTIKAYGEEGAEAAPSGFGEVGSNYLHVDTDSSSLLQRCVQIGGEAASIGDGIYLDTLVKFSPADKLFEASVRGPVRKPLPDPRHFAETVEEDCPVDGLRQRRLGYKKPV